MAAGPSELLYYCVQLISPSQAEAWDASVGARHRVIKASEARQQWSRLLNSVFQGKTRVIVEKSGIPVAAVISTGDFDRLVQHEARRAEQFKALEASWRAFEDVNPEDIEREAARAVASARKKLRG